jgi:type VI secretion system VasI/ImpG family protein
MELLDYYRDNLSYLRGLGAEFAADYPKVARRLSLDEFDCQDPYVERILEGTAFLAARVERKLDKGYYRLLESLLSAIAPASLYPIPSGSILSLEPNAGNEAVVRGGIIPALTAFMANIPGINTPCVFSTISDTPVCLYKVQDAGYQTRDLNFPHIPTNTTAALHFTLAAMPGTTPQPASKFLFYINMSDEDASLFLKQLEQDRTGIFLRQGSTEDWRPAPDFNIRMELFDGGPLYKKGFKGSSPGLHILSNFFSYPAFFKFFSLDAGQMRLAPDTQVLVTLKRKESNLALSVNSDTLRLNCTPCLNIMNKRSERIPFKPDSYEFHISGEKTAANDYEVVAVKKLEFFNARNEHIFDAGPFYDEDIAGDEKERKTFFALHRRRTIYNPQSVRRTSYEGTEVFVSLSSRTDALKDAAGFSAEMVVTNRGLPLLLAPGQKLQSSQQMALSAQLFSSPTRPLYPLVENGSQPDWAVLSPLLFNTSATFFQTNEKDKFPLAMLKDLLRSYNTRSQDEIDRILEGINSIGARQASFRFVRGGSVFFEWGSNLRITLDETKFAGIGYYSFARVLKSLLEGLAPLNMPLELSVYTGQSGLVGTWKTLEETL